MSVDLALRATFRNFSSIFLVVAAVTVPLHVIHSFWFRDVHAIRDIRAEVGELEPGEVVRGISAADIDDHARSSLWLTAAEIALIPLFAGATRSVLGAEARGEVPRLRRAWAGSLSAWKDPAVPPGSWIALGVGLAMAVAVVAGADRIAVLLAEPVNDTVAFGPLGLGRGVAHALGAPFFLVPLALRPRKAKARSRSADVKQSPDN